MMGMMSGDKAKDVSLILGSEPEMEEKEEKEMEQKPEMVDALFKALESKDKEGFKRIFDQMVEASYYRMKMKS